MRVQVFSPLFVPIGRCQQCAALLFRVFDRENKKIRKTLILRIPPTGIAGFGGEEGIRTPETLLTFTRFPGGPVQPLLHLSSGLVRESPQPKRLPSPQPSGVPDRKLRPQRYKSCGGWQKKSAYFSLFPCFFPCGAGIAGDCRRLKSAPAVRCSASSIAPVEREVAQLVARGRTQGMPSVGQHDAEVEVFEIAARHLQPDAATFRSCTPRKKSRLT